MDPGVGMALVFEDDDQTPLPLPEGDGKDQVGPGTSGEPFAHGFSREVGETVEIHPSDNILREKLRKGA